MSKIVYLLIPVLLIISYTDAKAQVYYVASETSTPPGKDSNPGTKEAPWATVYKAFMEANPGDTIYYRDGIYMFNSTYCDFNSRGINNGTASEPIHHFNYPGESPIFDYSLAIPRDNNNYGIYLHNAQHLEWKGITLRNVFEVDTSVSAIAFSMLDCKNIRLVNMTVHNIGGRGFKSHNSDSIIYYNCDAYNICDTLNYITGPGNRGTGFGATSDNYTVGKTIIYKGCRAWMCSDQGFSSTNEGLVIMDSCWSWKHGLRYFWPEGPPGWKGETYGTGSGIKFGFEDTEYPLRLVSNCIAAYCQYIGFHDNAANKIKSEQHYINNLSYNNGAWGYMAWNSIDKYGKKITFHNNIGYNNGSGSLYDMVECITSNNSWDTDGIIVVDDNDFVSLDTSELRLPRKEDGSLPYINFGKLSPSSDLIDAGIDIGNGYNGEAPDLGPFERLKDSDGNFYPHVVITSPSSGETFTAPGPINIEINTSDPDGNVSKVEFFDDTEKVGELYPPQNSFSWNSASVGYCSLYAVATDNNGAKTTSPHINLFIVPNENDYADIDDDILLYPNPNSGNFRLVLKNPLREDSVL